MADDVICRLRISSAACSPSVLSAVSACAPAKETAMETHRIIARNRFMKIHHLSVIDHLLGSPGIKATAVRFPAPLYAELPYSHPILRRNIHAVAGLDSVEVDKIIKLSQRHVNPHIVHWMRINAYSPDGFSRQ